MALLGAPFLIWNTIIKQRSLGFQKEGHITDRISKAVEQLGAEKTVKRPLLDADGTPRVDGEGKPLVAEQTVPNIEVRIGGILSLERIAQDSCAYDHGRDHMRVMEILCAYVRENASSRSLEPTKVPFQTVKTRIDIQKALDAIKRRSEEQRTIEASQRYRLDLRECNLDGCDLSGGNLSAAIMWRCRLEATDLSGTDLTGSQLQGSLINFANFRNAILRGTNLNFCTMCSTNAFSFTSGKFLGTWIEGAKMSALSISTARADELFGSMDTELNTTWDHFKREALRIAEARYLDEIRGEKDHPVEAEVDLHPNSRFFLHWNPYEANDFASGEFREKYRKRKGLSGWPFEG